MIDHSVTVSLSKYGNLI